MFHNIKIKFTDSSINGGDTFQEFVGQNFGISKNPTF